MNKWNKDYVKKLEHTYNKGLTDNQIARNFSISFSGGFTAESVKKKRHRLGLFKKYKSIINGNKFYVKLSKKKIGKGYSKCYLPLEIIKKKKINDNDIIVLNKNNIVFFSKIYEITRRDRPNNYFSFYVPFNIVESTKYNCELIEYLGKICEHGSSKNLINNNEIDLYRLLRNKINNKIQIWRYSTNDESIYLGNGRTSVALKISRLLRIDKNLLNCLGFFQGEGSKTHPRRVAVVNSDSTLINMFIDYFEEAFDIKKNLWKVRVIYTNPIKDVVIEGKLVLYWSNITKIPLNNFVKSYWVEGIPQAKMGSLHIYLPSSALREVWMNLLRYVPRLIEKRKDYALWFMQGVLAADGCPIVSNGYLQSIQIRIENKEEGELYIKALDKIDIYGNLGIERREINILRNIDILKVFKYNLFGLHKDRRERFLKYLLSRKRINHLITT